LRVWQISAILMRYKNKSLHRMKNKQLLLVIILALLMSQKAFSQASAGSIRYIITWCRLTRPIASVSRRQKPPSVTISGSIQTGSAFPHHYRQNKPDRRRRRPPWLTTVNTIARCRTYAYIRGGHRLHL